MDKEKLRNELTEIIAIALHANNQKHKGVTFPNSLTDGWKRAYHGTPQNELPPFHVELNHFKNDVDFCVSLLMREVENAFNQ